MTVIQNQRNIAEYEINQLYNEVNFDSSAYKRQCMDEKIIRVNFPCEKPRNNQRFVGKYIGNQI